MSLPVLATEGLSPTDRYSVHVRVTYLHARWQSVLDLKWPVVGLKRCSMHEHNRDSLAPHFGQQSPCILYTYIVLNRI